MTAPQKTNTHGFRSLTAQIAFVLLVGLSLVMIPTVYLAVRQTEKVTINAQTEESKQVTSALVKNVSYFFQSVQDDLEWVAADPQVVSLLQRRDPDLLAKTIQKLTLLEEIRRQTLEGSGLFDVNCTLIASAESSKEFIGKNFAQRDYCQGILRERALYASSVFVSSSTHNPTIVLALPVRVNGDMIGFVVSSIRLTGLQKRLPLEVKDDYIVLLDRDGSRFLDSREVDLNKIEVPPAEERPILYAVNQRVKSGESQGSLVAKDRYGIERLVVFQHIKEYPMTILLGKSTDQILQVSRNVTNIVLWSFFFSYVVLLGYILYTTKLFGGRLRHMTEVLKHISLGDVSVELDKKDLAARNEIGELARAFERVMTSLKLAMRETEKKPTGGKGKTVPTRKNL